MKIEYICDVCGERFGSKDEADACERKHKRDEKREELRKKSEAVISDLYDKHIKEFHDLPEISLSEESSKILVNEGRSFFGNLLSELLEDFEEEEYKK